MDLTRKPYEASDRKVNRKTILYLAEKKQLNARILQATNQHFPCKQYELN